MIFKKYAAFFQPHELDALTAAYVAVWQEVRATGHIRASEASVLRTTSRRSFSLRPAPVNGTWSG
jgi:hypothetical protein